VRVRLVALALVAGLAMIPLIPSALYERVFDPYNYRLERSETMRARLTYWSEGLNILQDNWLLGIGIGNQTELPRRLRSRMDMPDNSSVHNEYLQSFIESGLIGYPWLAAFIVVLWLRCLRGRRVLMALGRTDEAWLIQACFVALMSMLFFGTQVDVLHFPLKGWWLAMGVAIVLSDQARRAWLARERHQTAGPSESAA
jgi:O-antigen ligase